MKKILILSACTLALLGCGDKTAKPVELANCAVPQIDATETDANIAIDAWFQEGFMSAVAKYPEVLTQLGMKTDNDKWNNPSKEFYLETVACDRAALKYFQANFDTKDLDESHALSYRLYVNSTQNDLKGVKYWDYGYSFNQMFGVQSGAATFLINQHRVDNVDDAQAYIARLNGLGPYMMTHIANARDAANKGIMPPKFVFEHVIRDTKNIVTGAPFTDGDDSALMADFRKKVGKLELPQAETDALITGASAALTGSVQPAFAALVTEMERQQAIATTEDGAWKLPNGSEYYAYRLGRMTTTDMTATEIHDLGLSEMDRIHGEMRAIMKTVGFDGTLQEFFTFLKTDPQFYYEDSDEGRAAYLAKAEGLINTMKTRLDDVFIIKPKADLVVKLVEPYRAKSAGKAFYNRPAPDGSRPGVFYANLYEITDMPTYQMEALAYHEGIPGHHMQIAIQQELGDIPMFRKFSSVTAYSEGWGLYTEYLPKEMGFYEDPYSDFGRLSMELWRAARLVVDTGLHDKKWTREEAIDYLTTNTPNPLNDCVKAIERYIVMPGQATAYKIGMIKILGLREAAKETLGDKFDIREYHNVILSSGPVPLNIMEERVNAWVASKM